MSHFLLRSFLIFALTVLVTQASAIGTDSGVANAATNSAANSVANASPAYLPDTQSDQLAEDALQNLLKISGQFDRVSVSVRKGTVVIEGLTKNEKDLEFLEKAAAKLPSVIAVVNRSKPENQDLVDLSPAIQEGQKLVDRFKRFIPPLLTAGILVLLLLFVGRLLSALTRRFWSRRIANPFLLSTVSRLSLWPLWIVFFYFILQAAGLSSLATTIIGGTGILGIILGLAFKGIAENYLAGLLLATRAPFTRGDLIIVNDQYKGYVQNLNMRGTTIVDLSGHLILIPNSTVINSVVENQTANPKIRTEFLISISYEDSIANAQKLLVEALKTVRGALLEPAPDVIVEEFGSSLVKLRVRVWFNVKETNEPRFRSRAMALTKETLLANGFTIPTDVKQIIISDPVKIRMMESKEEAEDLLREKKDRIIENAEVNLKETHAGVAMHEGSETQAKDLLKLATENPLMKDFSGDPQPQG